MTEQTDHFPNGLTADDLPPGVRRFFDDFFVDAVDVVRREAHLEYLGELSDEDRQLAVELLILNLRPPRSAVLIGLAHLAVAEAVPDLLQLQSEVESPGWAIEVGRCLTSITGNPEHLRPLVEAMAERGDSDLKEAYFSAIGQLPPMEQIDLLLALLEDRSARRARALALRELNALECRKQFLGTDLPHDVRYFRKRRSDPAFRERLAQAATESRSQWEPGM